MPESNDRVEHKIAYIIEKIVNWTAFKERPAYNLGLLSLRLIEKEGKTVPVIDANLTSCKDYYVNVRIPGGMKSDATSTITSPAAAITTAGGKAVPVILDSGTTLTHFPRLILDQLIELIDSAVSDNRPTISQNDNRRSLQGGILINRHERATAIPVILMEDEELDITEEFHKINTNISHSDMPTEEGDMNSLHNLLRTTSDNELMLKARMRWELSKSKEYPQRSAKRRTRRRRQSSSSYDERREIRSLQESSGIRSKSNSKGQVCWYLPYGRADLELFPILELTFIGGAVRRWHPEQYTYLKTERWRCLTISRGNDKDTFQLGMSFFIDQDIGFHISVEKEKEDERTNLNKEYREGALLMAALRRTLPEGEKNMGKSGPEALVWVTMRPAICPRYPTRDD